MNSYESVILILDFRTYQKVLVSEWYIFSRNPLFITVPISVVVLIPIICLDLRNWSNVYLNFSFFTVFLKNRNISSKIKRSKVTDYAALNNTDQEVLCIWPCGFREDFLCPQL